MESRGNSFVEEINTHCVKNVKSAQWFEIKDYSKICLALINGRIVAE